MSEGVRPGDSYRHEAYFYRGDDEFLAGALPLVHDGLETGADVVVAVPPPRIEQLRAELGGSASAVTFLDTTDLSRNPTLLFGVWSGYLEAARRAGRALRGVGEPVWPGRSDDEVAEYQLLEALTNLAVPPDASVWLRCPYNADALDDERLDAALCSHPVVADSCGLAGSRVYGGGHHAAKLLSTPLPEPTDVLEELEFQRQDLRHVRTAVRAQAEAFGLRRQRVGDLALAVHELAANSVRHGGGRGRLRVWRTGDGLRCEVSDAGVIADPLVGRRPPEGDAEGGRGIWVANRLCDLVQLRSGPSGTTVRVTARAARTPRPVR
jgi:anti-sigma regulatory factor (Ser/Thr protein kinase)